MFFSDLSAPEAYRPISLSMWGKIFDKILTTSYYYLEGNFYSNLQYGFRKRRSTAMALDNVMEFIRGANQERKSSILIVLDIKGAFDRIQWRCIRERLRNMSIPNYLKAIINSFISHRKVVCKDYVLWWGTSGL